MCCGYVWCILNQLFVLINVKLPFSCTSSHILQQILLWFVHEQQFMSRHCNNCTIHWSSLHLQINYWHIKDWRWLDFVLYKHTNGSWTAIHCMPWLVMVSGQCRPGHDIWPCQCLGAELGGDMKTDCAPRDCMLSAPSPASGAPPPCHHGGKWFKYGAMLDISRRRPSLVENNRRAWD